jgi:hypothetical protein
MQADLREMLSAIEGLQAERYFALLASSRMSIELCLVSL